MTKDEARQLIDETFPSTVDGVSRPTDYIAVDMPYNEDMPQYMADDYVAPEQPNLVTRQLLSNDKAMNDKITALTDGSTAVAQADKLTTARTITLSGSVTGSASFDGSKDVTITTKGLVGAVEWYAGSITPAGYLLCDGSAISRTYYAELFEAIGTTYGTGDGSTTFNLPCLTDGRFIEGSSIAGTKYSAGLPNITGAFKSAPTALNQNEPTGCYSTTAVQYDVQGLDSGGYWSTQGVGTTKFTFDASRCSSVYNDSTTVQPKSLTLKPVIRYI